jgi:hypothetical protein
MSNRKCSREEAQAYIVKTDNDRSAYIMKYFHEEHRQPGPLRPGGKHGGPLCR